MSYDYLLYRAGQRSFIATAIQLFSGKMGKVMAMAESLEGPPIGSIEEVKIAVSRVFPTIQWCKITLPPELTLPISGISDWTWRTTGDPEIGLGADPSGNVRLLSMARADPGEVRRISRNLNLRVIDEQAFN
jgi:hypothetical protein